LNLDNVQKNVQKIVSGGQTGVDSGTAAQPATDRCSPHDNAEHATGFIGTKRFFPLLINS
jgi:hypothetical protein